MHPTVSSGFAGTNLTRFHLVFLKHISQAISKLILSVAAKGKSNPFNFKRLQVSRSVFEKFA